MRTTCLAAGLVLALAAPGMASSIQDSSRAGAGPAPRALAVTLKAASLAATHAAADSLAFPVGGQEYSRSAVEDTSHAAPRDTLTRGGTPAALTTAPRHWNATSIVLATEAGNVALASLVFLPHGSKFVAGIDGFVGFVLYMAPMDTNPRPDENSALVSGILAGGFALMAVANWGSRRIDLTDQQKFWMNIAGPHLVIGVASGSEWISKRLYRRRHPASK